MMKLNARFGVSSGGARRAADQALAIFAALTLVLTPVAGADRTRLKPGMNFFSPQQDAQIGFQNSQQADKQLPMLRDARVDNYLNALGKKLVAHAPGEHYNYQFRCVNDRGINAFALPGGFVYVNRGVIESADTEAQLAGVMAHEISHVALRHGTSQASKAALWQGGLGIAGAMVGGNSVAGLATQLGGSFGVGSLLLKYSRTAETQADVMGTQILYDSGYDPRAMSQFFEKIEAESKGKNPPEFFSDHPVPEHRVERVNEEIDKMGGVPSNYETDSAEFRDIKRYILRLPPPPKRGTAPAQGQGGGRGRPAPPSDHYQSFENENLQIRYPDNWRANGSGDAANFVPDGGVVNNSKGQGALAYGVIVSLADPHGTTIEEATDQLLEDLRQSNSSMRLRQRHEHMRVDGEDALSTYLTNDSPAGGKEVDWVVTVLRPRGLLYIVCVAPESEYGTYDGAFQAIVNSIRFPK
jgi:hypothetical protein